MSIYICEKCGCLENSGGGGNYWNVKARQELFSEDYANRDLLCRFCVPKQFSDGETYSDAVEEMVRRPKKVMATLKNKQQMIKNNDPVNAKEYFEMLESRKI